MAVKNAACERLLEHRVDVKMKSKKMMDCLNRFHVAVPKPRDNKERSVCIPPAVLEARVNAAAKEKKLEKGLENENGGAGVYSASLKKHYILANDEWKEDILPEILDGHNFAHFVDPDIKVRCEELEREEGLRLEEQAAEDAFQIDGHEFTLGQKEILAQIRKKKALLIQEHRMKKRAAESRPIVPRKFDKYRKFTTNRMGWQLSSMGVDPSAAMDRARSQSRGRKRERSVSRAAVDGDDMEIDGLQSNKKLRLTSRSRLRSRAPEEVIPGEGFKDSEQKKKAIKKAKAATRNRNKDARRGEADG
jgi:nucleolar GTP-binding protein